MKPYFFINCFQKNKETSELYSDDFSVTNTAYFIFLSESKRGNKILLRFYDEFMKELPEIFIYEFEKDDMPEKIYIPFYISKRSKRKYLFHYDIFDIRLKEKYFSGKFVIVSEMYDGHMDIGFICSSDLNPDLNIIIDYHNHLFPDSRTYPRNNTSFTQIFSEKKEHFSSNGSMSPKSRCGSLGDLPSVALFPNGKQDLPSVALFPNGKQDPRVSQRSSEFNVHDSGSEKNSESRYSSVFNTQTGFDSGSDIEVDSDSESQQISYQNINGKQGDNGGNNIHGSKKKKSHRVNAFSVVWNRLNYYNFDILYHCGNYSLIRNLYEVYKKNMLVTELFKIFRTEIIKYYSNKEVSIILRSNWNINMFNETDLYMDKNNEQDFLMQKEFIYYLKIMYERYFSIPERNYRHSFNSTKKIGGLNIISLDSQLSFFYEDNYFTEKLRVFLERSLQENMSNLIILNRPLRYLAHRDVYAEKMLKYILELSRKYKINIVSSHKNGYSYTQTHHYKDIYLDEYICSGFNNIDVPESFLKKVKLKFMFYCMIKKDRMKAIYNSEHIKTDNIKNLRLNQGICMLLNNFVVSSFLSN
jgi:hypothetical protein